MTTEQSNQLQSIYERVQDLSIYDILNLQFQQCWYYENCPEYGKYLDHIRMVEYYIMEIM